jgi:hypothetical protein
MNYFFTQKELSYLDDLLPGTQEHVRRKKKLTLHEINVEVFEKARKDQNEMIKRTSIRPEDLATKLKKKEAESGEDSERDKNRIEEEQNNEDSKPFV